MHTKFIFWGAILAGVAVMLGAMGAHFLADYLPTLEPGSKSRPPLEVFQTGVQYQFMHSLALILVGILYRQRSNRHTKNAGLLFILGILLFSGSLYFITIGYLVKRSFSFIGPLTPLGGISFIIGWILLAFNYGKKS